MIAELRDSLENLYPDSALSSPPCATITTEVARGGFASVHILISGCSENACIRVLLSEKRHPVREAIWHRLIAVPVEENTGLRGFTESSMKGSEPANSPNPFVVRRAPFLTYDAMEPVEEQVPADSPTVALRCDLPISRSCQPAEKTYEICVGNDRSESQLRWRVRITKATIPAIGSASFPVTNWFSYENIASRHGLQMWSSGYWSMLERYARLMAHGRQNVFWIPLSVVFEMKNGLPLLFRDRLRRIVRIFTGAGLHYIEGGHIAHRSGGKWEAKTFDVTMTNTPATSAEGNRLLAAICRQLMEEIDRNGWRGRWIQHATDEPTANNSDDYRILVGMLRKYMPGIPVLDATMETSLVGSVDIWCPQVQEYQKHRDFFEGQKAIGDRVWFYTCCFPGGPWLNRLLDQELVRPALFGWAAALFGLDGFLHWGLNQYRKEQNLFQKSIIGNWGGGSNALPAGDTHVIYPGKNGPWSGLRFEAQREGWEDLELLKQLLRKDERKARAIIRRVFRAFDDYDKTPSALRSARHALLRALS